MWEWLVEPLAMDLTNTVRDVRGETVDYLQSADAIDSWLAAEGDRLPAAPDRGLATWRALRDAIAAAFAATLAGEPLPADAVERINATAASAPLVPRLHDGVREEVAAGSDDALARVAASAIELLGTEQRELVRFCAAPSCGMYYLASRTDQRWCSTACGTRARVARHAQRHRATT
jgi:predicted RNA-binding Zn ribbon-like protein